METQQTLANLAAIKLCLRGVSIQRSWSQDLAAELSEHAWVELEDAEGVEYLGNHDGVPWQTKLLWT